MDVITGKTRPDAGTVFFGQTIDLTKLTEAEIAHAGIGRKFQKPTVFEQHSVFENLELAMKCDKRVRASLAARLDSAQRDRIAQTLELIHLAGDADRDAGLLSHGQKQWLEIGMLLMQEPRLLLLDEPVAGMTDEETERTGELCKTLAGKHSVVVVEHDMEFVAGIAHKVTVLHEGSVLAEGSMEQVQNDARVIEVYLGDSMITASTIAILSFRGRRPRNLLLRSPKSRFLASLGMTVQRGSHAQHKRPQPILRRQPHAARRELRPAQGLHHAARAQRRGQDHAAEMPDGPGAGEVRRARARRRRHHRAHALCARAPGHRLRAAGPRNLPAPHGGGKPADGPRDQGRGAAIPAQIFDMFPVLKDMLGRRGGDLSGGQQQQLAIGRALAMQPKLLILDEPTEGIQPSIIKDIERVIRLLAQQGEMAILLVEQYYDFARSLADHYVVMSRGEVIKSGAGADMERDNVKACLAL